MARPMTKAEVSKVLSLYEQGYSPCQIAGEVGFHVSAVRRRLSGKSKGPMVFWTPERDAHLRSLAQGGYSAPEIATKMQRTVSSVVNRARQIGVTIRPNEIIPGPDPLNQREAQREYARVSALLEARGGYGANDYLPFRQIGSIAKSVVQVMRCRDVA